MGSRASDAPRRPAGPPVRSAAERLARLVLVAGAVALAGAAALAQDGGVRVLPQVTVTASGEAPPIVEKSYRKMQRGVALFEREHRLAPLAALRFKLLPRQRDTDMDVRRIEIFGSTHYAEVPVAEDGSFALPQDPVAAAQDAQVTSDRQRRSMTWRADIRTPGLPPGTRRLGDLRLECRVGMESGLVSEDYSVIGKLSQVLDSPSYCDQREPRYYFFADRAVFDVMLVEGSRRESLPVHRLYAGAVDEPALARDLPYCDCQVLVDRTYELPLGDASWSDNTLVQFTYMDGP